MRWCEQYPARERRELWVSTSSGQEIKLVVHGREMPARRGHQVTALLLGDLLVAIYNNSTGKQVNYIRTDPPLLWRRCDAGVVLAPSIPTQELEFQPPSAPCASDGLLTVGTIQVPTAEIQGPLTTAPPQLLLV